MLSPPPLVDRTPVPAKQVRRPPPELELMTPPAEREYDEPYDDESSDSESEDDYTSDGYSDEGSSESEDEYATRRGTEIPKIPAVCIVCAKRARMTCPFCSEISYCGDACCKGHRRQHKCVCDILVIWKRDGADALNREQKTRIALPRRSSGEADKFVSEYLLLEEDFPDGVDPEVDIDAGVGVTVSRSKRAWLQYLASYRNAWTPAPGDEQRYRNWHRRTRNMRTPPPPPVGPESAEWKQLQPVPTTIVPAQPIPVPTPPPPTTVQPARPVVQTYEEWYRQMISEMRRARDAAKNQGMPFDESDQADWLNKYKRQYPAPTREPGRREPGRREPSPTRRFEPPARETPEQKYQREIAEYERAREMEWDRMVREARRNRTQLPDKNTWITNYERKNRPPLRPGEYYPPPPPYSELPRYDESKTTPTFGDGRRGSRSPYDDDYERQRWMNSEIGDEEEIGSDGRPRRRRRSPPRRRRPRSPGRPRTPSPERRRRRRRRRRYHRRRRLPYGWGRWMRGRPLPRWWRRRLPRWRRDLLLELALMGAIALDAAGGRVYWPDYGWQPYYWLPYEYRTGYYPNGLLL